MRAHRRREIWKSRGRMSGLLRDSFGTLSSVSAGLMISKLVTFSRYWHDFLFFLTLRLEVVRKKYITELSIYENLACCSVGIYAYSSLFSHPVYTAFDFILSSYLFSSPPKIFFCPIFCSDFESTGYTRPRPIPVSKYFDNITHAQICNHLEVEMNMAAASWMNFERLLVILSPISSRCVGHKYVP